MEIIKKIDISSQRTFGLPYLRLTRDYRIHDRCRYLMSELADIPEPLSLIDVGCGSGMPLRYLYRSKRPFEYCGIDLNASRLRSRFVSRSRHHANDSHRFEDVNLDDDWHFGLFDVAWCSEVLEHLLDDVGVLSRIANSVGPDGTIILTMPSVAFIDAMGRHLPTILETSEIQDGGHVRKGYSRDSLCELAASAGCRVDRIGVASRCSVLATRVRYTAPSFVQGLNNAFFLSRSEQAAFVCDIGHNDHLLSKYHCITAVLRRSPSK